MSCSARFYLHSCRSQSYSSESRSLFPVSLFLGFASESVNNLWTTVPVRFHGATHLKKNSVEAAVTAGNRLSRFARAKCAVLPERSPEIGYFRGRKIATTKLASGSWWSFSVVTTGLNGLPFTLIQPFDTVTTAVRNNSSRVLRGFLSLPRSCLLSINLISHRAKLIRRLIFPYNSFLGDRLLLRQSLIWKLIILLSFFLQNFFRFESEKYRRVCLLRRSTNIFFSSLDKGID